jgi:hypothetical protein
MGSSDVYAFQRAIRCGMVRASQRIACAMRESDNGGDVVLHVVRSMLVPLASSGIAGRTRTDAVTMSTAIACLNRRELIGLQAFVRTFPRGSVRVDHNVQEIMAGEGSGSL